MRYRVLCAYDGSPSADRAFDFGARLAKRFEGGELHVVTVVAPAEPPVQCEIDALLVASREKFGSTFGQLQRRDTAQGVQLVFKVCVGYAAQQVLHYAEQMDVHHIVTGRRGISAMERWTMGSVSQKIVLHAISVVTVVP